MLWQITTPELDHLFGATNLPRFRFRFADFFLKRFDPPSRFDILNIPSFKARNSVFFSGGLGLSQLNILNFYSDDEPFFLHSLPKVTHALHGSKGNPSFDFPALNL